MFTAPTSSCSLRGEVGGHPTQEVEDAAIIHLYKWKGNSQVCDNHRGISLSISCWKDTSKILSNRLNVRLNQTGLIPESVDSGKTEEQ